MTQMLHFFWRLEPHSEAAVTRPFYVFSVAPLYALDRASDFSSQSVHSQPILYSMYSTSPDFHNQVFPVGLKRWMFVQN